MQIFTGEQAQKFISIIGDDKAKVITPVVDTLVSQKKIGHIIIYKGWCHQVRKEKTYACDITTAQRNAGIIGSFIFVGSSSELFNHLFNNVFSGKITKTGIMIDLEYRGLISFEFTTIIKNFLEQYR